MKWLFIVVVLMIGLPFFLRWEQGISAMPGTEAYYHSVAGTPVSFFSGALYVWEPFHFIAGWWDYFFGSIKFLPAVLAFISFCLFWLLLNKLDFDANAKMWSLVVLVLSPTFISTAFFAQRASFALVCVLLGAYLLLARWRALGIAFFVLAGLSGWIAWLGAVSIVIFLMLLKPFLKKSCSIILGILFVILVLFPFPPFLNSVRGFAGFLSDLGGIYGISVFVVLLMVVAAAVLWSNKAKYYSIFALLVGMFGACFFYPELLIYANVFICGLAGFALSWLQKRKWQLAFLRDVSLLVLFCGLLFSAVAHTAAIAHSPPSDEFFDVLDIPKGRVLTHPNYGFWLQSQGFTVIADPYVNSLPDAESRLESLDNIFKTNSLKDAKKILDHYEVDYVLLTDEMRQGLVWNDSDSGLAFLVSNPETFKIVRNADTVDIWRVK
ncbi:hypothetical protein KY329_01595 [Candidatus Woesearchaeota archaeon]|nr:hypothetical protein [Candidatus Woesearchaeota archaeon]